MEAAAKVQPIKPKLKGWQPVPKVYSELVTITPQKAQQMLINGNFGNRPLSQYRVKILAEAIERGEWVTNSNSIGFDVNGNLIDGQHRLNAIIWANQPIISLVTYNLPAEAFVTTDIGKNRSSGDIAAILGIVKNSRTVGSVANLLYYYEHGSLGKGFAKKPTNTQIRNLLRSHMDMEASAAVGQSLYPVLPPSVGGFCHYLFSKIDQAQADEFMEALKTGANLSEHHPCLTLRNFMLAARAESLNLMHDKVVAMTILAWNYFRKGRKIKVLRWKKGEEFPKPI